MARRWRVSEKLALVLEEIHYLESKGWLYMEDHPKYSYPMLRHPEYSKIVPLHVAKMLNPLL